MKRISQIVAMGLLGLSLNACVAQPTATRQAPPQTLLRASAQVEDSRLLDVWIETLEIAPEQKGRNAEVGNGIHEAEARFIPIHLRDTMQATGYWGAVRVMPRGTSGGELVVAGTLRRSDGQTLTINIRARDALGEQWFARTYSTTLARTGYDHLERGERDAFQDVYNRIANDLARVLRVRSADEIRHIRDAAALRFAADLAPTPYGDYFSRDRRGRVKVERLPAKDDPLYNRVLALKDRDEMLMDTLNAHYDQFYNDMWESYVSWRKSSLAETLALEQIRREANAKKMAGAAAILGAIALEVLGGKKVRQSTGSLRTVLVVGGAMAIKAGIDQAAEGNIHEAAIRELGQSFEAEVSPMVVEVDGEIVELTGSADVQFTRWRQLLHRRYVADTETEATPATTSPGDETSTVSR